MKDRTYVAVGCSTFWDYCMLLPVAMLLWRELVGHHPVAFLVGTPSEWQQKDACTRACLNALNELELTHGFILPLLDYEASTVAQSVRQHIPANDTIADADWVMMTDADLLPLQRDFYRQHEGRSERAVIYHAESDCFVSKEDALAGWDQDIAFQALPTCHVTMRAREWRALYQYLPENIGMSTARTLDRELAPRMRGKAPADASNTAWHFDQYYLTERLCRQEWFPADALLIRRGGLPRGHLAPWHLGGGWEGGFAPGWLDAHIRKGAYAEGRWRAILPLIEDVLPARRAWVEDYFLKATKEAA